jgi:predicted SAM-dependent methyltransferase
MNLQYVQYGCGWYPHYASKNWRNFDASPTLRLERIPLLGRFIRKNETRFPQNVEYGDIIYGLPVLENSCKVVYCSHVLEHLSLEDFRKAIRNTHKILESGGTFRFVLPDLEYYIQKYIDDPTCERANNFMHYTGLGKEKRNRSLKEFVFEWLGNSQHLWMWDYKSLKNELEQAGFVKVRRAQFADSIEPMFQEIEFWERWENCLGLECKKHTD